MHSVPVPWCVLAHCSGTPPNPNEPSAKEGIQKFDTYEAALGYANNRGISTHYKQHLPFHRPEEPKQSQEVVMVNALRQLLEMDRQNAMEHRDYSGTQPKVVRTIHREAP